MVDLPTTEIIEPKEKPIVSTIIRCTVGFYMFSNFK